MWLVLVPVYSGARLGRCWAAMCSVMLIVRKNFLSDLFHIDRSWVRPSSRVVRGVDVCFGFALNHKTMHKLLGCRLLGRLRCWVTGFWNPDKRRLLPARACVGESIYFSCSLSPLSVFYKGIREGGIICLSDCVSHLS
jgi:hypothetical protein